MAPENSIESKIRQIMAKVAIYNDMPEMPPRIVQERGAEIHRALRSIADELKGERRALDFEWLIGMLLSCVERAEGIVDGGPITREAEKHVNSWKQRHS